MNIKDLPQGAYKPVVSTTTPKLNIKSLPQGSFKPVTPVPTEEPGLLKTIGQEILNPFERIGATVVNKVAPNVDTSKGLLGNEIKPITSPSEFAGETIMGLSNFMGGGVVKEGAKVAAKSIFKRALPKIANVTKNVVIPGAKAGAVYGGGQSLERGDTLQEAIPNVAENAAYGGVGAAVLGAGLPAVAKPIVNTVRGAIRRSTPEGRMAVAIENRAKELEAINNNYVNMRKSSSFTKDERKATINRVAETDVLVDSVDENGLIRTNTPGGAIDQYKALKLDGKEDVVRANLERNQETARITDIKKKLDNVVETGKLPIDEAEKAKATNKVIIDALLREYPDGNVPLVRLHDEKIKVANLAYKNPDPTVRTKAKDIARGYKELVEDYSSFDVKKINQELAPIYEDIKFLEELDGKRVKGGKLSRNFAQISGNIIGGAVGSAVGGPYGAAIGAATGGELASKVRGVALSKTLGRAVNKEIPKNPVLEKAKELSTKTGGIYSKIRGNRNVMYNTANTTNNTAMPRSVPITKPQVKSDIPSGQSLRAFMKKEPVPISKEKADEIMMPKGVESDKFTPKDREALEKWLNKKPTETEIQDYKVAKEAAYYYDMKYELGKEKYDSIIRYVEGGKNNKFGVLPEMGVDSGKNSNGRYMNKKGAPYLFQKKGDTFIDELGFKDREEAQDFIDKFKNVIEQRKNAKAELSKFGSGLRNNYGAVAGIQVDEEGNVTFDPKMAAMGAIAGNVAGRKGTKDLLKKVGDKANALFTTSKETKTRGLKILEKEFGDKESATYHAEHFWAKDGKPGVFHHVTKEGTPFGIFDKKKAANFDVGLRSGISNVNGLYVGKDVKALHEFYNLADERGDNVITYKGEPKLLDLTEESAMKEFTNKFKTGDEIEKELTKRGYDGVKYFDPLATGEEIVITNTKALEPVAFNGKPIKSEVPPPYKEAGNLTTKILKDLEGKSTVSKQYILDATNRGELKQQERDLIRSVLDGEGDTVNVSDFAKKVQTELLPLERNMVGSNYPGATPYASTRAKYENITLPKESRGSVKDYSEHVYESPIKTSAGNVHFSSTFRADSGYNGKGFPNYFGHTRIEDMADDQTRRVIEVQSDLYQKGNLERESPNAKVFIKGKGEISPEMSKKYDEVEKDYNKLQQYSNPTAHFRMVREEIKKASDDGKTKLQFPTGETAMKIEGLGSAETWSMKDKSGITLNLTKDILDQVDKDKFVGTTVFPTSQAGDDWVVTKVLGDGKFKAVSKRNLEALADDMDSTWQEELQNVIDDPELGVTETFDVSGKLDTNNPIYRFYEKDLGRYLTSKYGAKIVTDDKGVNWYEVAIDKKKHGAPVEAFAVGGLAVLGASNQKANAEEGSDFDWESTTTEGKKVLGFLPGTLKFERKKITHPENIKKFEEMYSYYPDNVKEMIEAMAKQESGSGRNRINKGDQKDGSDSLGLLHMGQKALDEFNKRKEYFGYTGPDLRIEDLKEENADIIQKFVQASRIMRDMRVNNRPLERAATFIQNQGEKNYGINALKKFREKQ